MFRSGELTFKARFQFHNSVTLSRITLEFSDAQCGEAIAEIRGKYGKAYSSSHVGRNWATASWRDDANNLNVITTAFTGFCEIAYSPLRTANGAGL